MCINQLCSSNSKGNNNNNDNNNNNNNNNNNKKLLMIIVIIILAFIRSKKDGQQQYSYWNTSFEKNLFFCMGDYAECGFNQQGWIWYVCCLWDTVFS